MRAIKKLLLILSILIFSCSTDKYDFEKIEIMYYNYNYDYKSNIILDRILYSYINRNGLSQTIRKINSSGKEIYYESNTNPELLNKIISETKNKNEEYYNQKKDSLIPRLYGEPIIRFRLIKKNLDTLSFTFENENNMKKFRPFYTLYKSLIGTSPSIRNPDELVAIKQKEFEKFAIYRDTTELIVPLPPRINQIKFIKPKIRQKH